MQKMNFANAKNERPTHKSYEDLRSVDVIILESQE